MNFLSIKLALFEKLKPSKLLFKIKENKQCFKNYSSIAIDEYRLISTRTVFGHEKPSQEVRYELLYFAAKALQGASNEASFLQNLVDLKILDLEEFSYRRLFNLVKNTFLDRISAENRQDIFKLAILVMRVKDFQNPHWKMHGFDVTEFLDGSKQSIGSVLEAGKRAENNQWIKTLLYPHLNTEQVTSIGNFWKPHINSTASIENIEVLDTKILRASTFILKETDFWNPKGIDAISNGCYAVLDVEVMLRHNINISQTFHSSSSADQWQSSTIVRFGGWISQNDPDWKLMELDLSLFKIYNAFSICSFKH